MHIVLEKLNEISKINGDYKEDSLKKLALVMNLVSTEVIINLKSINRKVRLIANECLTFICKKFNERRALIQYINIVFNNVTCYNMESISVMIPCT